MTILKERQEVTTATPQTSYAMEWVLGAVGALAAVFGAWMRYGPEDGVLSLFNWDWNVASMAEGWPFSLLIVGFVGIATAFGFVAMKVSQAGQTAWATAAGLVGLGSLAAAVTYLITWIA